jgi:hypothetical protein
MKRLYYFSAAKSTRLTIGAALQLFSALTATAILAMMGLKTHEEFQKKYLDWTRLGAAAFRAVIRIFFQHFLYGGQRQNHRKDDNRQFQGRHNLFQPENPTVLFYRGPDRRHFFPAAET